MEKVTRITLPVEYDREPVFYCEECLSLAIKTIDSNEEDSFCNDCGSTNIASSTIEEWQELYRERYGHYYITPKINYYGREEDPCIEGS